MAGTVRIDGIHHFPVVDQRRAQQIVKVLFAFFGHHPVENATGGKRHFRPTGSGTWHGFCTLFQQPCPFFAETVR